MEYKANQLTDGMTVLEILRRELNMSRAAIKHLKFTENGILLNGAHVTVRATVKQGDVLSLAVEDIATPDALTPCKLDLSIAYEDGELVIPNKPAHMPTHQSHGHYGDTVANALAYRYAEMGLPFVFRPINRLDKDTSGLLLIARNRLSAATLTKELQSKSIQKEYVAVLCGILPNDSGVIDTFIGRTAESIIVRRVCRESEGGDRAITQYRVLCRSDTHTLVSAVPVTGRTHQLRVHFASLGCPIEGDSLYGAESPLIDRQALHSFRLELPHPTSGEHIRAYAPLPDDMMKLADTVFGDKLCYVDADTAKYIFPCKEENTNEN